MEVMAGGLANGQRWSSACVNLFYELKVLAECVLPTNGV